MNANSELSYLQFQFVVLIVEAFGENLKALGIDEQHTVVTQLYRAWDNHDEVFRDHYAYPMSDIESIQQWFDDNKPKIESLIAKTLQAI